MDHKEILHQGLRRQRDAFTAASMARAEERRADKERRRARLDGPGQG